MCHRALYYTNVVFFSFWNGLSSDPRNWNQLFRENMLMKILFQSAEYLLKFHEYLNARDPITPFSFEQENVAKLLFLNVEVSQQQWTFVTTVYRKTNFSSVYIHFDSILPTAKKFGIIYIVALQYFKISSDRIKLNFMKNLMFWNKYFQRICTLSHLLRTVLS